MKKSARKVPLRHRKYPSDHLLHIYRFLEQYHTTHTYMPSKMEVALKFKTHHSSVGFWYGLMEEAGMIKRNPGIARAIQLLPLQDTNQKESTHERTI